MRNTTSRARRRRSARAVFLLLWLIVSLTASSGCGGSDEPGIPRATAEALAGQSDLIADTLARGDRCTAAHEADRLLDRAIEAVNSRTVPARFHDELIATANELVNAINCPPPPPVAEEEEDEPRGKGKNSKGKKGGDD